MKFFKVISTVIIILFNSNSYAELVDTNTLKQYVESELEKEFGKNYRPFYEDTERGMFSRIYRQKPLTPKYYKDNNIEVPKELNYLYDKMEDFLFFNLCSSLEFESFPKPGSEGYKLIENFLLPPTDIIPLLNFAFNNLTTEQVKEQINEGVKYFSEKYNKASNYYSSIKILDPEGKVTVDYNNLGVQCINFKNTISEMILFSAKLKVQLGAASYLEIIKDNKVLSKE